MELTGRRQKGTAPSLLRWLSSSQVLLAEIVLLAATMRFFKLGEWSFWIDEVYTVNWATAVWDNLSPSTPLSVLLTGRVLGVLGIDDWNARLVSTLIGIASIPVLYFPIKRLFGTSVALLSALLLALSPWHLHWSQNARFYTALMLFYSLSLFAFYLWLESDRFKYLAASGVLLWLAYLERMMAAVLVPVVAVYLAALYVFPLGKPAGWRRGNLALLAVPAALAGLHQAYSVGFEGRPPFYAEFLETFVGYTHNPVRVLLSVVYEVGLPLFLLALIGGVYLVLQRSRAGLLLLIGALLPLALLVAGAPFLQTFSRYVFHTLPCWIVLAVVAVKELSVRVRGHARVLAFGVLLLVVADPASQDVLYYLYQNGNREDWKGAFAQVQQRRSTGDVVVTTRPEMAGYYLGEEATWTQGLQPDQVVSGGRRTWFVIDNRTGFVSPRLQSWLEEETRLVAIRDVNLPGKTMMMRVYLYDPERP